LPEIHFDRSNPQAEHLYPITFRPEQVGQVCSIMDDWHLGQVGTEYLGAFGGDWSPLVQ
jgi:hypothetical protein